MFHKNPMRWDVWDKSILTFEAVLKNKQLLSEFLTETLKCDLYILVCAYVFVCMYTHIWYSHETIMTRYYFLLVARYKVAAHNPFIIY